MCCRREAISFSHHPRWGIVLSPWGGGCSETQVGQPPVCCGVAIPTIFSLMVMIDNSPCIVRERQLHLYGHVARLLAEDPTDFFLSRSEGLDHAEWASTHFMVAPGGVLSEGYGPRVCLGDGQTKAEGVPSRGGRGDALLHRMPPYLT